MHTSSPSRDLTPARKSADNAVAIFVVIVIYKMQLHESATVQSLQKAIQSVDASQLNATVLIADNTPGGQRVADLPAGVRYRAFPENPGLVTPYNLAIAQAEQDGCRWLLTLDQDTHLPSGFLTTLAQHIRHYDSQEQIAAIVPRIFDRGVPISPLQFKGGFLPVVVGPGVEGMLGPYASALNSASLLRISALKRAGGYDPGFPLNNSDTAMFHRLDRTGFRIALAGDVAVEHELGIMRREDRMTPERYRRLLLDERHLWDLYMGPMGRLERLLRLAARLLRGFVRGESGPFRRITLGELRTRLYTRRSIRLSEANHARSYP